MTEGRHIVVVGGAYAGGGAAALLSRLVKYPDTVTLIDRQSHFNHVYLFPRFSVIRNHSEKALIPFEAYAASAPKAAWIETLPWLPKDADANEGKLNYVRGEVLKIEHDYVVTRLAEGQLKNIPWHYLIYATGSALPPALMSDHRTKEGALNFLDVKSHEIANARKILIVGGGALGIQYATDIADLYNNPENAHTLKEMDLPTLPKEITLVHSRDRLMSIYEPELHDKIIKRLDALNINLILGERVVLSSKTRDSVTTERGKVLTFDLILQCTGQKPNSQTLQNYIPQVVDEKGYVKVKPTLEIDLPPSHLFPKDANIFAIGDVAETGAIKAGHVGYFQSQVVSQTIYNELNNLGLPRMVYTPTPPMIKITTGLYSVITQTIDVEQPPTEVEKLKSDTPVPLPLPKLVVNEISNDAIDCYADHMWKFFGVDYEKCAEEEKSHDK